MRKLFLLATALTLSALAGCATQRENNAAGGPFWAALLGPSSEARPPARLAARRLAAFLVPPVALSSVQL